MSVVPTEKKLTEQQLEDLASSANIDVFALKAFCEVEGGGIGFSDVTGRIIIQFEPHIFKRENVDWEKEQGVWLNNGISNQTKEWKAFNDAFIKDRDAALKATSIGLMQVLGVNWKRCNFDSVSAMWEFNELSESNQLETGIRFIMGDPSLYKALKNKNWSLVAEKYNGAGFRALAIKTNSIPYDNRMANAFIKFSNQMDTHRTTATVNLRSGYDTKYPILNVLRPNTALQLIGNAGGWSKVRVVSTAQEGWVNSKFLN